MIQNHAGRWAKYLAVLVTGASVFQTESCTLDTDSLSTLLTDLVEVLADSVLTALSS
jgi:hypothetical protein